MNGYPPASAAADDGSLYDRGFWLAYAANVLLVTANSLTFRFAEFVAALGGTEEVMNRVIRALGQIQAKGKVAGKEMIQLAEAGIPGWRYIAEFMQTDIVVIGMLVYALLGKAADLLTNGLERGFLPWHSAYRSTWQPPGRWRWSYG